MPDSLPPEDEIARLRVENEELKAKLEAVRTMMADPIVVHHSMLAGTVAMPAIRHMINLYGPEAVQEALSEMAPTIIPPTLHTHPNPKREGGEA